MRLAAVRPAELNLRAIYNEVLAVLALIEAAGWPIWPLIFASIIALAIIIERAYALRSRSICPPNLLEQTLENLRRHGVNNELLRALTEGSPMGRVFASGLRNLNGSRELMKESLEETGRSVAHELERYLTALGTIATVAPLLGLLGTVIGMIEIFGAQSPSGGNPAKLAHGISVALYNTAFGLIVAIPSMIFYRYYRAKVDTLLVEMEQQALRLVDIVRGEHK